MFRRQGPREVNKVIQAGLTTRCLTFRDIFVSTPTSLLDPGVGEEPESFQVAGGVHTLRQQRVDLVILKSEVARDADTVRDVNAEVVGREIERPGIEDHPVLCRQ